MWSTSSQSVDAIGFATQIGIGSTGTFDSYQPVRNSNNVLTNTGYQQWRQQMIQQNHQVPQYQQCPKFHNNQQWPQQMIQQNHQVPQYQQCPDFHNNQQTFKDPVLIHPNHSTGQWQQSNQFQISQVQGQQQITVNVNPISINTHIPESHQARMSSVSNTNGGFRAIVKRKRKRTQFTTEQIEALESYFRTKPYITREERQIFVEQLQVSDSAVKVWFQNRRLRGKKEEQEYCSGSPTNEEFYNRNSRLDYIEAELIKKADQFGFITLDETAINEIVSVVDGVLSADIELDNLTSQNVIEVGTTPDLDNSCKDSSLEKTSKDDTTEEVANSEGSTCGSSFYEPISPATSVSDNEQPIVWNPLAPKQSLQRLFDLHFC